MANIDFRTHLTFLASSPHPLAVCFVDARRYGNWDVTDEWGVKRGPDPVSEYAEFRANVVRSLRQPQFSLRLSEALLDQEFFNGIGKSARPTLSDADSSCSVAVAEPALTCCLSGCCQLPAS